MVPFLAGFSVLAAAGLLYGEAAKKASSYSPVVITEPFDSIVARWKAAKPEIMKRQMDLLSARYDLSDRPVKGLTMSRGKPIQEGVRVKLPEGMTWEKLAAMSPEQIREKDLWPAGFFPLPHPNHPEGGMLFPKTHIEEIKKQEARDLIRFDLDFDIPAHFLPESPAAIYLTTRPDLGDVSQGKLVTIENYFELFNGILNPKQLEGLRLLVTPFPQQQFNQTDDRRSEKPSRGLHVWIATRTVIPTRGHILSEIFDRRNLGTDLIRPRCEESTFRGCSDLRERSRAWKTSPSSSSVPPTLTGTL